MKSALHAIGISDENGWLVAAIIYGAGGSVVFVLGALGHVPRACQAIAVVAIVTALVCAYGIRHWKNGPLQEHMRTSFGLLLIFVGTLLAGPVAPAMMALPLLAIVTPCYLYGPRFAMPYAVAIVAGATVVAFEMSSVQSAARAIMFAGVSTLVIASMMVSERQTRALARINRRLAYSDPLTGIANTRRLREDVGSALHALRTEGSEFALFAIDLDDFKQVNDTFGHGKGDEVLQAVATELSAEIGPRDLLARRGGDEFSVLVPLAGAPDVDLEDLASRMALAIQRAREQACPSVTPTGGVAYVRASSDDDLSSILTRADEELHRVKDSRRALTGSRRRAGNVTPFARDADVSSVPDPVSEKRRANLAGLLNPMSARASAWIILADILLPISLISVVLTWLGLLEPLATGTAMTVNGGLFGLAAASIIASHWRVPQRFLHVAFSAAIALIAVEIAAAGPAGNALIDILCALMFVGVYMFPARFAATYAAICGLLFFVFATGSGYEEGLVRSVVTVIVFFAIVGAVIKVRSITIRFTLVNKELSQIDALTGAGNTRALEARLESAIEQAKHGKRPPLLVSIDLVDFKSVNDRYSHTVGDETLRAVVDAIGHSIRSEDFLARRGGDEFVIVGEYTDEQQVGELIERLRKAIREARARLCPDLDGAARIGWGFWHAGVDATTMLRMADEALLEAKIASGGQPAMRNAV